MRRAIKILFISLMTFGLIVPAADVYASNYAFCVGTNYGSDNIDTSDSATYAANCLTSAGYKSYSYVQPTASILRGSYSNGSYRMESEILFFAGHANYNNINWNYLSNDDNKCGVWIKANGSSSSTGYKYAGLKSFDLSDCEIAMFFGCKTGLTDNGNNLVDVAYNRGASVAIGWKSTVNSSDATKWRKAFVKKLSDGATVKYARTYANSLSYNNTSVKNTYIKGDKTLKLSELSTAAITAIICEDNEEIDDTDDNHIEFDISKDIIVNLETNEYSELTDYIKENIISFFDEDEYNADVIIYENEYNCGNITFTYTVNNSETSMNFSIEIEEGKVSSICSNGTISMLDSSSVDTINLSDEELIALADTSIATNYDESYIIISDQEVLRKYNIEEDKSYAIILTEYYDEETDSFWVKDTFIY